MNLLVVSNSDDIAANLITKFSFENSISDSNGITGGVGTDKLCTRHQRHIKDLLVFYRLQQRSKSFDCYKSITVSMWIKQTHIQEHNLYLCYQNH
jgi:hypothetical protein